MTTTDILTFDQGVSLLIYISFFIIIYAIYDYITSERLHFVSILTTSIMFAVWLFTITISSNVATALSVKTPKISGRPFLDKNDYLN